MSYDCGSRIFSELHKHEIAVAMSGVHHKLPDEKLRLPLAGSLSALVSIRESEIRSGLKFRVSAFNLLELDQ
jgi:hypothetical protein